MGTLLAFTVEQAAQVAGVSEHRLRSWERAGVLRPSLAHGEARGAFNRIYSFRDLVGLRILAALRDQRRLSLPQLRRVGEWLIEHRDQPLALLRFTLPDGDVVFCDDLPETDRPADQPTKATIVFDLEQIGRETEAAAASLATRRGDQIGEITRNRYVMSNAPVIAGTRIPTAAIWDFHQAGYSVAAIVEEYPRLTDLDVERAIAFERNQRAARRVG
jgi:uncharacterized protein (DUF433 family)